MAGKKKPSILSRLFGGKKGGRKEGNYTDKQVKSNPFNASVASDAIKKRKAMLKEAAGM